VKLYTYLVKQLQELKIFDEIVDPNEYKRADLLIRVSIIEMTGIITIGQNDKIVAEVKFVDIKSKKLIGLIAAIGENTAVTITPQIGGGFGLGHMATNMARSEMGNTIENCAKQIMDFIVKNR